MTFAEYIKLREAATVTGNTENPEVTKKIMAKPALLKPNRPVKNPLKTQQQIADTIAKKQQFPNEDWETVAAAAKAAGQIGS